MLMTGKKGYRDGIRTHSILDHPRGRTIMGSLLRSIELVWIIARINELQVGISTERGYSGLAISSRGRRSKKSSSKRGFWSITHTSKYSHHKATGPNTNKDSYIQSGTEWHTTGWALTYVHFIKPGSLTIKTGVYTRGPHITRQGILVRSRTL